MKKRTKEEAIEEHPVVYPDVWLLPTIAGWSGNRFVRSDKTFQRFEFFEVDKLLACLLPCRGCKPDRRRSRRRRRCFNAHRGLSPPKPLAAMRLWFSPRSPSPNLFSFPFEKTTHGIEKKKKEKQDYAPYEDARSYAPVFCASWVLTKLSLALEKARYQCWERCRFARFSPETGKGTKISAERDAKSHVSPRKLEWLRLDRFMAVDRYRGVDRCSESKLEPPTAVSDRPL